MKKTLYLHIGLPKTGTTSIQTYLRRNETALFARGYVYPGLELGDVLGASVHHSAFLNVMVGANAEPVSNVDLADQKLALASAFEWFRSQKNIHSMILSHETLSMMLDRWDHSYLQSLSESFHICFILYSRFTDEWIESLYHQNIWGRIQPKKEIHSLKPIREIEKSRTVRFMNQHSAIAITETLHQHVPDSSTKILSFDADRVDGTLVSSFLSAVHLEQAEGLSDPGKVQANATRPSSSTFLLYDLQNKRLDLSHLRSIGLVLARRSNRKIRFDLTENRLFRFLPRACAFRAREQYERDRKAFPQLPPQAAYGEKDCERFLPAEDAIAMLDWLLPEIPNKAYEAAISVLRS